jgi:hypothetical protein
MYKDISKTVDFFKIQYPNTIVPIPISQDYENGFIRRCFIRHANDANGHIFEISEDTYLQYLENPFWKVEQIKWRISGPTEPTYKDSGEFDDMGVKNSNTSALNIASINLKNIKLYLPNILQFHK